MKSRSQSSVLLSVYAMKREFNEHPNFLKTRNPSLSTTNKREVDEQSKTLNKFLKFHSNQS